MEGSTGSPVEVSDSGSVATLKFSLNLFIKGRGLQSMSKDYANIY